MCYNINKLREKEKGSYDVGSSIYTIYDFLYSNNSKNQETRIKSESLSEKYMKYRDVKIIARNDWKETNYNGSVYWAR